MRTRAGRGSGASIELHEQTLFLLMLLAKRTRYKISAGWHRRSTTLPYRSEHERAQFSRRTATNKSQRGGGGGGTFCRRKKKRGQKQKRNHRQAFRGHRTRLLEWKTNHYCCVESNLRVVTSMLVTRAAGGEERGGGKSRKKHNPNLPHTQSLNPFYRPLLQPNSRT